MIICSFCNTPIMPEVGCIHTIAEVAGDEWMKMSPQERRNAVENSGNSKDFEIKNKS